MASMIAICDKETVFVQILAQYLCRKYKTSLEIEAFDHVEKLVKTAKEKKISLCLLGEGIADSFSLQNIVEQTEHIIFLSCKRRKDMVFKYQSVEHVVNELLELCMEKEIYLFEEKTLLKRRKDVKIYAFYAPVRHLLQSTIALTMGQMLAREKKVLYLNLVPNSGFEYMLQKEYEHDLMDILFFLKEDRENFRQRMESMLERVGMLEYIPPVFCYPDMEEIESPLWHKLLQRIVDEMEYEVVLLDLTEHTRGLLSLLEICDEIYTCLPGDNLSLARAQQYEKVLRHMKKDSILERTKKSIVPVFHDIPLSAAGTTQGELVHYIKSIKEMQPVKIAPGDEE